MALARGLLIVLLMFAVIGIVLIAIALGTDNWKCFNVDSEAVDRSLDQNADRDNEIYYSRTFGFFRECFTSDIKPINEQIFNRGVEFVENKISLSKSPHGTDCVKMYPAYKFDERMGLRTKEFVNMKIAYITLYSIGLFIAVIALIFMLVAIGVKKGIPVVFTGFLFLIAAIFLAAAIGVWHKSNDELAGISNFRKDIDTLQQRAGPYENEVGRNWYSNLNWPEFVQNNTVEKFCWSYFIAWIGIGLIFLTALLSCCITVVVSKERKVARARRFEQQFGMQICPPGQPGQPVYTTSAGSEKGSTANYATGQEAAAAYTNYGYGNGYQYQYPQQGQYYDYMGYYNPFGSMQR